MHEKFWTMFNGPNIDNFGNKYFNELDQWATNPDPDRSKLMRAHQIRCVIKTI
jgi:hypothetical protein